MNFKSLNYMEITHEDNKPIFLSDIEVKEEVENNNDVQVFGGNENELFDSLDYERTSKTIERELKEFEQTGVEQESFSFDDLDSNEEDISGNDVSIEVQQPQGELEDYFDSAEFVIFITEFIILFGLNFYLKSNGLDKVGSDAFKKSKSQEKMLIKAWAKIMQKYNAKVTPELELVIALGNVYGMRINTIIDEQKEKKQKEVKKQLEKNYKEKNSGKNVKQKKEKTTFTPNFADVVEEEETNIKTEEKSEVELEIVKDDNKKDYSNGIN